MVSTKFLSFIDSVKAHNLITRFIHFDDEFDILSAKE